jgi:TolA-binding protein
MSYRRSVLAAVVVLAGALPLLTAQAQPGSKDKDKDKDKKGGKTTDAELVERLLAARKEYQITLENLRAHYIQAGDIERARWAEEELLQFHRINKQAYRLDMDPPPPTLKPTENIPEANELIRRALQYKDKGWGDSYTDNQRRSELLLQKLLSNYPLSDKIDEAAYLLGDVYESKAFKQYDRAARYYERCFQWNPKTRSDARLRAAHLYEKNDRARAIEIYREVTTTEIDDARVQEARKRLAELGGSR